MKDKLKAAGTGFVVTLFVFAAVVAIVGICRILFSTKKAEIVYNRVREQSTEETEKGLPMIDWQTLRFECPEVVGWLYCPDTPLNDPIVQGSDNDFYITHLATGEANQHGAIFADCHSGSLLTDENTLLFGHNMNDGTMLHGLLNWGNAEYAAEHPVIYILTPKKHYAVWIFSACVVDTDSEVYQTVFDGDKAAWLDRCTRRSYIASGICPTEQEPIVTFSTCSGKEKRFVVQGVAKDLVMSQEIRWSDADLQ